MDNRLLKVCTVIAIVLTIIFIRLADTPQKELYKGKVSGVDYIPSRYAAVFQSEEYIDTEYTPCEYPTVFQQE